MLIYEMDDMKTTLEQVKKTVSLWPEIKGEFLLKKSVTLKQIEEIQSTYQYGYAFIIPFTDFRVLEEEKNFFPMAMGTYGLDYHIRCKILVQPIIDDLTKDYYFQVDSGNLPEREIIKLLNIGQIGKNKCFFHEKYGSFVSLSILCTNEKLKQKINYQPKEKSTFLFCESCTICEDNCPTGALKTSDMTNCLSYLLQSKENQIYCYFEKIGESIYGCDICQKSCPYNKMILSKISYRKRKKINLTSRDFVKYSNRQFKMKFRRNAFAWRGKNILLRNAILYCIAHNKKLFSSEEIALLKKQFQDEFFQEILKKYEIYFQKND